MPYKVGKKSKKFQSREERAFQKLPLKIKILYSSSLEIHHFGIGRNLLLLDFVEPSYVFLFLKWCDATHNSRKKLHENSGNWFPWQSCRGFVPFPGGMFLSGYVGACF